MQQEVFELALFVEGPDGIRLCGRLSDADLVDEARERVAAVQRRRLAALEPPVRLVADPEDPDHPHEKPGEVPPAA